MGDSPSAVGLHEDDIWEEDKNIISFDPKVRDWVTKPIAKIIEERADVKDKNFMLVDVKIECLPKFRRRRSTDALNMKKYDTKPEVRAWR